MVNFTRAIFVFLLFSIAVSVSSKGLKTISSVENDKQTVELVINGDRYSLLNVNPTAQVNVYNIIGTKITTFKIKSGVVDSPVTLPKGYYILKIDDSTRKIAVK